MPEYRLYRLNGKGRIVGTEIVIADDDQHAIRAARDLKEIESCELWQRSRRVATIPPFGIDSESCTAAKPTDEGASASA